MGSRGEGDCGQGQGQGGQGAGVARTQWSHDGSGLLEVPVSGRERDASDIHHFHGGERARTRAVPGGTDGTRHSRV